jgi:hypothetical protein
MGVIWPGTLTQPTRIFTGSADAVWANIDPATTAAAMRPHIIKRMLCFLKVSRARREVELIFRRDDIFPGATCQNCLQTMHADLTLGDAARPTIGKHNANSRVN